MAWLSARVGVVALGTLALDFLQFPVGYAGANAWDFFTGSAKLRQVTVEEAWRLPSQ